MEAAAEEAAAVERAACTAARRRVDQEIAQEEESPPFIFYPALALLPLPSLPYPIPAGFGKLSTPREPIKVSKLIPSVSFNGLDP